MDKQNSSKSGKRMGIKWVILALASVPLLIACVFITLFAGLTMKQGMENQVMEGLRYAATGALTALDNISTESFHLVGEELYKGTFNVTQNMASIDYYASSNDVDITFFYDDVRRATTLRDSSGNRQTGTRADSDVADKVLRKGEAYKAEDVSFQQVFVRMYSSRHRDNR